MDGVPTTVERVLISTQHAEGSEHRLVAGLWEDVVRPVLPAELYDRAELRTDF